MQTALVAGGAGFIGSHLCNSLLNNGLKVVCVDNLITGDKKNIEDLSGNLNFKFIEADVTKPLDVGKVDFIFHLASPASPNERSPKSYINHPLETLLSNSLGTYELLKLAKKYNSKFLYASSSEVYGDSKISPQKEDYFGNVNPNGPRSVYDEGKRFGEAITMSYFRKEKLDVRIIRIFNTYGPNMSIDDGRVVSNFINQAIKDRPITVYGEGLQTRSLCFVDDLVIGLESALFLDKTKGEVINLGNPDEKTILEIAKIIKEMTNSKSEIVFDKMPQDDPRRRVPDISKAQEILNWQPKITLRTGLGKTIEYFRSINQ